MRWSYVSWLRIILSGSDGEKQSENRDLYNNLYNKKKEKLGIILVILSKNLLALETITFMLT